MAKYRHQLPQLCNELFITDGGLETTLVFQDERELPCFAAFDLLKDESGYARLRAYFEDYIKLAKQHNLGFVLESATWRASTDWGTQLGYSQKELDQLNHRAIELLHELRDEYENDQAPIVISGCIGPRGDGYAPDQNMTVEEAAGYHLPQIKTLGEAAVDMVSAFTIPTVDEAIGMVQAAQTAG
ncbi:MAG: homocysteine S-methyltransferase family protein, partial [Pseudomonadota bacterium]